MIPERLSFKKEYLKIFLYFDLAIQNMGMRFVSSAGKKSFNFQRNWNFYQLQNVLLSFEIVENKIACSNK